MRSSHIGSGLARLLSQPGPLVATVLIGLVVIVLIAEVAGNGGEDLESGGGQDLESEQAAEPVSDPAADFIASCVTAWNQNLSRAMLVARDEQIYASVGPSADFPDQCLVTLAWPNMGMAGWARQYTKLPGEDWRPGGTTEDLGTLDAQTKDWNVTAQPNGKLSYP